MQFPVVTGSNLLRQKITLPDGLGGTLNILFVPFYQWQQMEVDSWIPIVQDLEQVHPGLCSYELPTIQKMNMLSQIFINEGMRAGIPNHKTRERTITLYIDKTAFRRELEMTDEEHIYVLLVDRNGNVLWRERGVYLPEKSASLHKLIQETLIPVS
jgi:hypothetical protein